MILKYTYSQLQLHKDTAKHCNFNTFCEDPTGTYRFKTGFYGLTYMRAEFPENNELYTYSSKKTFYFLDDIMKVSTRSESEHIN